MNTDGSDIDQHDGTSPMTGFSVKSDRRKTRRVMVGDIPVGDGSPISVQTLTKTITADSGGTGKQIDDGVDAVSKVELHEDPLEVGFGRGLTDVELGGDLGVVPPASDTSQDLAFSSGEPFEVVVDGRVRDRELGELLDETSGDRW